MILATDEANAVPCVKTMPFGNPVVPDECISSSGASAVGAVAGSRAS